MLAIYEVKLQNPTPSETGGGEYIPDVRHYNASYCAALEAEVLELRAALFGSILSLQNTQ